MDIVVTYGQDANVRLDFGEDDQLCLDENELHALLYLGLSQGPRPEAGSDGQSFFSAVLEGDVTVQVDGETLQTDHLMETFADGVVWSIILFIRSLENSGT